MNLRSNSPSGDKLLSKGKFDFSIVNRALSDIKVGLRS